MTFDVKTVQFSPLSFWDVGGRKADSAEILFKSFLQVALVSRSGMGRDVHSLMLSIQHFLCRPWRRPTLQGSLKDGFGKAVVPLDMSEPHKFSSLSQNNSMLFSTTDFSFAVVRDADQVRWIKF